MPKVFKPTENAIKTGVIVFKPTEKATGSGAIISAPKSTPSIGDTMSQALGWDSLEDMLKNPQKSIDAKSKTINDYTNPGSSKFSPEVVKTVSNAQNAARDTNKDGEVNIKDFVRAKKEDPEGMRLKYLFSLSSEELEKKIKPVDTSELEDERKRLKNKLNYYNHGDKSKFKNAQAANEARKRLAEIGEQIKKAQNDSKIAFTSSDGQNITWQSLYDQKKQQEEFNALYTELSSKTDWEKSVKKGENIKNPKYDNATNGLDWSYYSWRDKERIENPVTFAKTYGERIYIDETTGRSDSGDGSPGNYLYTYLTDDEAKVYNYYRGIGDEEKANDFLESMEPFLKERHSMTTIQEFADLAEKHPIFASGLSVATNLVGGIEFLADTSNYLATGELDQNTSVAATSAMRGTVAKKVDWNVGEWDVFDFLYNTGMSTADSVVATAAFGKFGGVALGLSAAAQGTNDALNRGMDKGYAFASGLAAGVFETVFESWQIGAFTDLTKHLKRGDIKNLTRYIGKNMWNNAKEETLTEFANIVYDTLINGDFAQYEIAVRQLMASGSMSESQAKKQVALRFGGQIAEATASGALTGFGFSGLGAVQSYINSKHSPEYENAAANDDILDLIQKVKSGKFKANDKVYLENITDDTAKMIQSLTGIDVTDFKVAIEARQIEHILKDHGATGKTDQSMSNDSDIAKIEYILNSPDSIINAGITKAYVSTINGKNKPAKTVLYEKQMGEQSYYAVQAVPDTKAKTLYIVSAFIGNSGYKKETSQTTDTNSPGATPKSENANVSSDINISQNNIGVNNNISKNSQDYSQNQELQSTANDGIINQGGDENVISDRGTTAPSVKEIRERYFSQNNVRGNTPETAEAFAERARRAGFEEGGGERTLLKSGTLSIAYIRSDTDSPLNRFVKKLNSLGIEAYCCEGPIEINKDGVTGVYTQALTTSKGKIFFCDMTSLSNKEKADHELVHYYWRQLSDSYFDYEDVIINNLNRESNYYIAFCEELNEREFNNKYNIDSFEDVVHFYAEITAYVYQNVLNNRAFADEFFSNMFNNWEAVVEAVYAFNSKMEIDTSELTEATPDGAASFLPENGEQGEGKDPFYFLDETEEGERSRPIFRDPDIAELDVKKSTEENVAILLGEQLTTRQRQVERTAKLFGVKLRWDPSVSRGKFDPKTNTIIMNPDIKLYQAYGAIFGHEFVHYLENRKGYKAFKEYLFKHSKSFEEYIRIRYREDTGTDFKGTRAELFEAYSKTVYELYTTSTERTKAQRESFTMENAEQEMVADFVGDVILAADGNFDKTEATLKEIANTNRSFLQRFKDFVTELINKLKGYPNNKTLTEDLEYLKDRLAKVYDSAANKKAAQKSGEKSSIVADSKNRKVVMLDRNIFDNINDLGQRAEKIEDWIIKNFGGQKYNTSDYFFVMVNERTAGKMKFWNENMDESTYKTKLSAAEHIDELIKLSKFDRFGKNMKGKHNEFAKKGWNYFKTYLTDGKRTYEADMSVAKTNNQSVLYNIGYIKDIGKFEQKKESSHSLTGSPNELVTILNNEASNRNSTNRLPQEKQSVNTYSTQETEKNSLRKDPPHKAPTDYAKKILRNNHSKQETDVLEHQIKDVAEAISQSDYGAGIRIAVEAARGVIEASSDTQVVSDDALEILDDIRNSAIRLDSVQKAEAAYSFGSYGDYFRRNMGRIKIRNEGVPLDTKWQEWAELYPELFDKDISPADQPVALANIVDTLKGRFVELDTAGAVESLASQIFTEAVSGYRNELTGEMLEAIRAAQAKHRSEISSYKKQLKQKDKRIARQNEQLARRRSEVVREETERRNARADKQKNIEYIRREVRRIDKLLRTNSDTKNIPESLKGIIGDFVKVFVENDRSPFDKKDLGLIHLAYSELEGDYNQTGETVVGAYDLDVKTQISNLAKTLDGKNLKQLDNLELLAIRDIVDNFKFMISEEKKMFINNRKYDSEEIGRSALHELARKGTKTENAVTKKIDGVMYESMTPTYFFKMLGGVFETLWNDVVNGQNKWFKNMELSKTYIRTVQEKYNYSKWKNDTVKYTTLDGDALELSVEQAMQLYATAKREKLNTLQMAEHLYKGGIVLDNSLNRKKISDITGKLRSAKDEGRGKLISSFSQEVDSKAHKITPIDVGEINLLLSDEQKGYADAMVDYLSNDMAELGNEVSMKLFGIKKYNEGYYIPYNSAQNFLFSQPGVNNETRLKHQSFTKQTTVKANNPLVLSGISTVCADHINRMCMYNALTLPLENMNRIYNFKTFGDENVSPESVKAELDRVYGEQASKYLNRFMEDMNGNVRKSGTETTLNRWISKFKKGAVFASASVVIQQPSAMMRAMALVDPKYFISTTLKASERDYQQAIQYAPVAGIKEMGRFDTSVGVSNTNWLLYQDPKGAKEKVKAFFDVDDSTYRDDKFSTFAAKADEWAWSCIWAAVKAETADKTDFEAGSEEFLEYAGKRFTEVINATQVYDSTLSRSQIMRDKSTGAQMLTAFMSEPTVSLNLLMDAARQAKTGGKEGKKYAARAVGAFVANVIVNAMLKSLVTAGRDDDEEKTYLEKYLGDVFGNTISDLFVPNMIPFVKDVISIFEGYTVERADMSLFSDLAQSVSVVINDNKSVYEKIESVAGSLAAFLGLPVKNVLRDIRTAKNIFAAFFINDSKTDSTGIKYEMLDALGFGSAKADKYAELAEAAAEDNEKAYQKVYKHLLDMGEDESDIRKGLKKAYRESGDVASQAEMYMGKAEKSETYKNFSKESKEAFEDKLVGVLASSSTEKALGNNEKYDKLYEYYRTNKAEYKKYKQSLRDSGLSDSQITDGMELAKISYMQSVGVDIHEYIMYKIAISKSNADTDNSGGVSNSEKRKALGAMDLSEKKKSELKIMK